MAKSKKGDDSKMDTKKEDKTQMVKLEEGKKEADEGKQESGDKKAEKDKASTEKGKIASEKKGTDKEKKEGTDKEKKESIDKGKKESTDKEKKESADKEKKEKTDKEKTDQKKQEKAAGDEPKSSAVLQKIDDSKEGPRNVVFKVPAERKPIFSDIKLENPTGDNKTFKVKCTSATIFRVQPPFGYIKPNDSTKIRVWFQNTDGIPTDGKKHYFAIYFMNSQDSGKPAKELWTKNSKPEGVCRINAVFEKKE